MTAITKTSGGKQVVRTIPDDKSQVEYVSLLLDIFGLLGELGVSRASLTNTCEFVLNELRLPTRDGDVTQLNADGLDNLAIAGHVLFLWHRDRALLDTNARPKKLKLFGRTASIQGVAYACGAGAKSRAVASHMLESGMIRKARNDLYLPKAMSATLSPKHTLAKGHCLRTIRTLVWNLRANMKSSRGGKLFERKAHVYRLPRTELKAFSDFSRQQGLSLISTINEWLEAKQKVHLAKANHASTIEAGVEVFAYAKTRFSGTNSKRS